LGLASRTSTGLQEDFMTGRTILDRPVNEALGDALFQDVQEPAAPR
jgi:hypothetical protein